MSELTDAVELTEEALGWLKKRNQLKFQISQLAETVDLYDEKLRNFMGDNPLATLNGEPAISFKGSDRTAFDLETAKRVLSEEQLKACYLTKPTARAFRVLLGDIQ